MSADVDLPLAGMLVLDFSQFLAGPVAALRLADLGARVVKIERPRTGEIGRTLAFAGRWSDGDTLSFHAMNRNKEAVVADLKDPADLALVRRLVDRADVLITNFRPGVMARLGLDHASVRATNPRLVYASATGYGEEGPWVDRPGQDLLAQAVSGLPWLNGEARPVPVGLALADHLMSCHIAQGVTALLVRAVRTGVGGLVQTSLLEAMLDLQTELLTTTLSAPEVPDGPRAPGSARGPHSAHAHLAAPYGIYPTADGHVALAMTPVDRLGVLLGSRELQARSDPQEWWTERAAIEVEVARALAGLSTAECLALLDAADVWCGPVLGLEELVEHEAFAAIDMVQEVERPPLDPQGDPVRLRTTRSPLRLDGATLTSRRAAPRLGQLGTIAEAWSSGRLGAAGERGGQ